MSPHFFQTLLSMRAIVGMDFPALNCTLKARCTFTGLPAAVREEAPRRTNKSVHDARQHDGRQKRIETNAAHYRLIAWLCAAPGSLYEGKPSRSLEMARPILEPTNEGALSSPQRALSMSARKGPGQSRLQKRRRVAGASFYHWPKVVGTGL
jgi:hypothetical protein